ncbi:MAG: acyl-CoA dehydrogenase family protein [Myxococcota bacterium]
MDFDFRPEEEAYRKELQSWLVANIPTWWRERSDRTDREDVARDGLFERLREWHAGLYDAGYVGVTWPEEYGGQGRTHVENAILQEELVVADSPPTVNALGIGLCGPALIHHGTEAQKKRFLRPMLRAEEIWCQGYSEPNAGSDLASVQTRAELRDDTYVVNGQKIWTSQAHRADWVFCLVRTDPDAERHGGIGFLLIDMKSPGIEVAPLIQITGARHFSQVFFEDVKVPSSNMVGSPTEGWRVANTVLGYERGASSLSRYASYRRRFQELRDLARRTRRNGGPASSDGRVRQKLAQLAIDIEVLRLNSLRQLTRLTRGERPGPESSIQKLYWSELDQRLARVGAELCGPFGMLRKEAPHAVDGGRWGQRDLQSRAVTIFAGTSEIQRNILAERVLGLPRR